MNYKESHQLCDQMKMDLLFNNVIDDFMLQQQYQVKESTYAHYVNLVDTHIRPDLGKIPVEQLSSGMIEVYSSEKLRNGKLNNQGGLSPKTVKDLLSLMRLILKYGVTKGIIDQQVLFFSVPRVARREVQVFSVQEQKCLEDFTLNSDSTMCFGVYLCLYTGLRIGEICALRWQILILKIDI